MLDLDLPTDWVRLTPQEADRLQLELKQELCPEHVLYGISATALARKRQRDDFLFRIPDTCFAQVHLTWAYEPNPLFPSTEVYASLEDWRTALEDDALTQQ